ncbi:MAG: hypothetical protein AB3X44_02470 [Leptothrix sp. (in: b-proteobacteria)]
MNTMMRAGFGLVLLGGLSLSAQAGAEIFAGADEKLGERLIQEHDCTECHRQRVGGDGSAIYRPAGRISTPEALRSMVEYCSTQLNLRLFPEETLAISAVLQRDHYRFK